MAKDIREWFATNYSCARYRFKVFVQQFPNFLLLFLLLFCRIIRLCIDLYCKNPHVLDPLRKFITLPSNRTIRYEKTMSMYLFFKHTCHSHVIHRIKNTIPLTNKTYLHVSRFYKNKVGEKPGWNDQVLKWCLEAAQEKGLKKEDYWGCFLTDEMKIQVRGTYFSEQLRQ